MASGEPVGQIYDNSEEMAIAGRVLRLFGRCGIVVGAERPRPGLPQPQYGHAERCQQQRVQLVFRDERHSWSVLEFRRNVAQSRSCK